MWYSICILRRPGGLSPWHAQMPKLLLHKPNLSPSLQKKHYFGLPTWKPGGTKQPAAPHWGLDWNKACSKHTHTQDRKTRQATYGCSQTTRKTDIYISRQCDIHSAACIWRIVKWRQIIDESHFLLGSPRFGLLVKSFVCYIKRV